MRTQLLALRERMAAYQIDACLIPTSDFHGSEYVGAHFACREYVSGFTGSAGTLLVFPNWAGLWTDGRYFLQAAEQLRDSGITLMRMGEPGTPTIEDFLRRSLGAGQVLAFDGRCVDARTGRKYHTLMKSLGGRTESKLDLVSEIWTDRPPLSAAPAWSLPVEYAGESRAEKLAELRAALAGEGAGVFLLTALEDIGWLLNLRGGDVDCTPVVLAYLVLTEKSCTLFANPAVFSPELREELGRDGVVLLPYDSFYTQVAVLTRGQTVLLDSRGVSTALLNSLPQAKKIIDRPNPTEGKKAVKNPTEQENLRKAHLADGIALTRFFCWLKTHAGKEPMTELSAAAKLEALRRECPDYLQPSFDPILAAGAHSAVIHYSPTPESDAPIRAEGFLLADTGGHYKTGTTDCTRTYALGELTQEQRDCYTAVLKGNLALGGAVFKAGTTGVNLDILARRPLWERGLDYNHGTGHGVGYLLSVHEGPQSIRQRPLAGRKSVPLAAGMVTSNEPGVYFDGAYGIRLENLTLCVPAKETPFGSFLAFETLTLTPFDLDAVNPALLNEEEKALLNLYHTRVLAAIGPHLPPEEASWLRRAVRPI